MSKSFKLSPKHGLNASITVCPICGKETGIAMFGRLKGDAEAPKVVAGNKLCDDCTKQLEDKVCVLEADGTNKDGSPIRTGRYIFVPKYCFKSDTPKVVFMIKEEFVKLFERNKED